MTHPCGCLRISLILIFALLIVLIISKNNVWIRNNYDDDIHCYGLRYNQYTQTVRHRLTVGFQHNPIR